MKIINPPPKKSEFVSRLFEVFFTYFDNAKKLYFKILNPFPNLFILNKPNFWSNKKVSDSRFEVWFGPEQKKKSLKITVLTVKSVDIGLYF